MDISQLKYFIALAQTQNFSEAARRCGISQPSMSHAIGTLEKQLDAQLFTRTKKNVTITDAGKLLLPSAIDIVEQCEKAEFNIKQLESGQKGSLTISALTTSSAAISRILKEFSKRHPDIITDIVFTSGREQTVAMNESKYDIHFAVREMVPAGESIDYMVTHHDRLCMAFPSDHPLANEPLDFSKLKDERFIEVSQSDGPALHGEIARICRSRGYTPNVVCRNDRAETVLLSVGAGIGIAIVPEALGSVFFSKDVVLKPIEGDDASRTYVVAWKKDISNPAAKLFVDIAKELYSQT